ACAIAMTTSNAAAPPIRRRDPGSQRDGPDCDRANIEAAHWCRSCLAALPRQPITGEARRHATADHHDQRYDRCDREASATKTATRRLRQLLSATISRVMIAVSVTR